MFRLGDDDIESPYKNLIFLYKIVSVFALAEIPPGLPGYRDIIQQVSVVYPTYSPTRCQYSPTASGSAV